MAAKKTRTTAPATKPAAKKAPPPKRTAPREPPATGLAAADALEPSASGGPTREEVARMAYFRWIDRGCEPGRDVEDWVEAERVLSR
jgi:hypothetical protein